MKNQGNFWQVVARFFIIFGVVFVLVSIFVISARAAEVSLQWDANDPAPDGYRVYQRTGETYDYSSPAWQGPETTCTIDGLKPATLYYFVVRAYVADDESGDSNEVDYKPPIQAPANLRISIEFSVYIDVNGVPYVAKVNPD